MDHGVATQKLWGLRGLVIGVCASARNSWPQRL